MIKKITAYVSLAAFVFGVFLPHESLAVSQLVKGESSSSVYELYAGKRYAFPNENVYFSWHQDFSGVRIVSDTELAGIPLGGNVTFRPGAKMIKIVSDPKVYAVATNGTLRWVTTEALARMYYGDLWQREVFDVSDALFVNYSVGAPITDIGNFNPVGEMNLSPSFTPVIPSSVVLQDQTQPTIPPIVPQPPSGAGSFREAAAFAFPQKIYQIDDWQIKYVSNLGFKDQRIRVMIMTSDATKRESMVGLKANFAQYEQNPLTGLGRTEDIPFYDDGTHGDQLANDAWHTAEIPLENWYGVVALNNIQLDLSGGGQRRFPATESFSGVTLVAFDLKSDEATIFESDHGVAVFPKAYAKSAQAYAQGVDRCYPGLVSQFGDVSFRNEKAYYALRIQPGYLENGGFINKISAPSEHFQHDDPAAPENNSCNPITSHELTHSLVPDTRKPAIIEEGFAEYTSKKIAGTPFFCEATGWRQSAGGLLQPYESSPYKNGAGNLNGYMTGVCIFKYIEDSYGKDAVQNIYRSMRQAKSYQANSFCTPTYQFYRDIVYKNTSLNMRQVLHDRFMLPYSDLDCPS